MQKYQAMIGTALNGRYLLLSIIGSGGMAVVFSAYDQVAGKTVAVKMLHEETAPTFRNQFISEANALSQIQHPGVVKLYEASLDKSPYFFVMEYVEGITLREYISRRKILPHSEVIEFSLQILSALSHIHSKGIVHCDIKPDNVILMKNGRIKLTDFGIARMPGVIPDLPPDRAVGTVYYVSPEQAEGKVLDHRSDLYSLGIMIYQMSSGKLPFMSNDIDKVALMQSSAPPKRPRSINPEISKGLEQIILKAISKKPYMRFKDAAQMRHYLELLKKNPSAVFRLTERPYAAASAAPTRFHSHNAYAILAGVCAAFALTAAISLPFIYKSLFSSADRGIVNIVVPDLKGDTLDEVAKKLDEDLYDIEIIYDYNSNRAPGKIISQSPASSTSVKLDPTKEQCDITITVSAEKTLLTMIDITALSPSEAEKALIKEGYTVIFEDRYSDTVEAGLACGTFPAANSEVMGGSQITVYVSLGPDITVVTIPDFTNKSEAEVSVMLKELGLNVGKVTYKSSNLPIGTVISQSVNISDKVPVGTAIDFSVSRGIN